MSWSLILALPVASWPLYLPEISFRLSVSTPLLSFLSWTNACFVRVEGTSDHQFSVTWETFPNIHNIQTSLCICLSRFSRYVVNMYSLGKVSPKISIIALCFFFGKVSHICQFEAHTVCPRHTVVSQYYVWMGSSPGLSSEELEVEFQLGEATEILTLNK